MSINELKTSKTIIKPGGESSLVLPPASTANLPDEVALETGQLLLSKHRDENFDPVLNSIPTSDGRRINRATLKKNHKTFQKLLKQFVAEMGITNQFLTKEQEIKFLYWFIRQIPKVPYKNWLNQRASIIRAIFTHFSISQETAKNILKSCEVKDTLLTQKAANTKVLQLTTKHGVGDKVLARYLTHEDYLLLLEFFRHYKDKSYTETAANWVTASLVTGLRPTEWIATELKELEDTADSNKDPRLLSIVNAKSLSGWVDKACRHQNLSKIWTPEMATIEFMVELGKHWLENGNYVKYRNGVVQLLAAANLELKFPEGLYVGLQTLRHQFKNTISWYQPLIEVAALMGHLNVETTKYDYGVEDQVWSPEVTTGLPIAVRCDVARIEAHQESKKLKKRNT